MPDTPMNPGQEPCEPSLGVSGGSDGTHRVLRLLVQMPTRCAIAPEHRGLTRKGSRLCNAYLQDDQSATGTAVTWLAIVAVLLWIVIVATPRLGEAVPRPTRNRRQSS
jgi:hypothetical protein